MADEEIEALGNKTPLAYAFDTGDGPVEQDVGDWDGAYDT